MVEETYEAKLKREAVARKKRLIGKPPKRGRVAKKAPNPQQLPKLVLVKTLKFYTCREVIDYVCTQQGITYDQIMSQGRRFVHIRSEAMYMCLVYIEHLSASYIAKVVFHRDSTTLMASVRSYCKRNDLKWPRKRSRNYQA